MRVNDKIKINRFYNNSYEKNTRKMYYILECEIQININNEGFEIL